jgi:hypothetical protein
MYVQSVIRVFVMPLPDVSGLFGIHVLNGWMPA